MALRGRKLMALMQRHRSRSGSSPVAATTTMTSGGGTAAEESTPAEGGGGTIKVGILSDCEGAFGSFFEPTASGANLALIRAAGGKPAGEKPTDGVTRRQGRRLGDRDRRLRLRRRHRRQGDRGDAPPDGAGGRRHPRRPALRRRGHRGRRTTPRSIRTRRSSTASRARRTRRSRCRRRTSSASTRTARSGRPASATTRTTSWAGRRPRSSATTTRSRTRRWPASWPSTARSAATSPSACWAPLGEEDYSSYISQIPEDIDGLYVGIGGSGLINFLKQYKQQRGKIDTEKMMGNVFWDDPLVLKEVGKDLVGGVDVRHDRGRLRRPGGRELHRGPQDPLRRRDRRRGAVGVHVRLLHRRAGADQGRWRRSTATSPTRRRCRTRWPRRRCRATRPRGATSSSTTTARRSRTCS